jgi:hypothetical protein
MADSPLAITAASIVVAILVGLLLMLVDSMVHYKAFLWWQIPLLIIFSGLGTFEGLSDNRIWAGLILLAIFLVLLLPAFLYYT